MTRCLLTAISVLLMLSSAPPALARTPAASMTVADPAQLYVFSFNDTPAAEAAQDVVSGALAYDLSVDPAVDGVVSFRAEGWSTGDALLRDFGTALLDQDIALMRTGAGTYALIPRANVPVLLSRGGVLMTLPDPASATPPQAAAVAAAAPPPREGDRWWESALAALFIFFAGSLAGAAALFGGQTVYRRAEVRSRLFPPPLQLTDGRQRIESLPETPLPDDDLVIPRFDASPQRQRFGQTAD
jgi:hypothetical protein